ncbi:hypothetical protein MPSEU_000563800 [Mayamaea pseudoterrestris]|nr:hypothetical protein MPSEU_000563800 [Mayamaea pseudoterrestris]
MKFCKNLQRVVEISDPEWAPYWTNYKMLKKLIKELPALVPTEETSLKGQSSRKHTMNEDESSQASSVAPSYSIQPQGDEILGETLSGASNDEHAAVEEQNVHYSHSAVLEQREELGRNPGEKAFFKLLHAEYHKVCKFFDKAQEEFQIREERVREGMQIMMQPSSIMVSEKWSMLAKSIYRLYKDLLLLETFAIMTYCSFSKILKKHDKMTGYHTRNAFMANVVNKSNFTNYPKVLEMISSCKELYEEVSRRLLQAGKDCLYEDERLFINMISRLNAQAQSTAESEGAPDRGEAYARRDQSDTMEFSAGSGTSSSQQESTAISTLRSLVEENDALARAGQVSDGHEETSKRKSLSNQKPASAKKLRQE